MFLSPHLSRLINFPNKQTDIKIVHNRNIFFHTNCISIAFFLNISSRLLLVAYAYQLLLLLSTQSERHCIFLVFYVSPNKQTNQYNLILSFVIPKVFSSLQSGLFLRANYVITLFPYVHD